jgi:hypothetical protein
LRRGEDLPSVSCSKIYISELVMFSGRVFFLTIYLLILSATEDISSRVSRE